MVASAGFSDSIVSLKVLHYPLAQRDEPGRRDLWRRLSMGWQLMGVSEAAVIGSAGFSDSIVSLKVLQHPLAQCAELNTCR